MEHFSETHCRSKLPTEKLNIETSRRVGSCLVEEGLDGEFLDVFNDSNTLTRDAGDQLSFFIEQVRYSHLAFCSRQRLVDLRQLFLSPFYKVNQNCARTLKATSTETTMHTILGSVSAVFTPSLTRTVSISSIILHVCHLFIYWHINQNGITQ